MSKDPANIFKEPVAIADWNDLKDRKPAYALVSSTDLVLVRFDDKISVMYGRCHHRGALLADGFIDGENLICGVHHWDYRYDTGVSEYNNEEALHPFTALVSDSKVWIDKNEVENFELDHPQPFKRDEYLGLYADTHPEDTEPYTGIIHDLAKNGLKKSGKHGTSVAMGVDRDTLPKWEDMQWLPAQLFRKPLLDEDDVNTEVLIGKASKKPLRLSMPLFVSDMSFGALSREAKIALAKGAEMAGTGIASGEGGMLAEEQANNSKYFYEIASAMFGFGMDKIAKVQAVHFKGGQGAKSGTGGHLPGKKVTAEIAEVRGLEKGKDAISPATFKNLKTTADFKELADEITNYNGFTDIEFNPKKSINCQAYSAALYSSLQHSGLLKKSLVNFIHGLI